MTSASPYWISRHARPIECVDVVQAVTSARFGPRRPWWIDTCPAAALMMLPGMKNGEILRGVFASSHFAVFSSMVESPPMPAPMATPMRAQLASVTSKPESLMACGRGGDAERHERIELPHVLGRHVVLGDEVLHLAADADREGAQVHLVDETDAAAAVDDAVPGGRDGAAERGNDA